MARRVLAILFVLMALAWQVSAQPSVSITIYVDQDSLTIYVPSQGLVSLDGFRLQALTSDGTVNRGLEDFPSLVGLRYSEVPTPICFRLVRSGSNSPAPLDCPPSSILTQQLAGADVFWYDSVTNTSPVLLILQRDATLSICGQSACAFAYTPPPTLFELARTGVTSNADWTPYFETFDGVEMALVPAGCFDIGEDGEGGRQCFEPFWIDRYEVTNAQYKRCVDEGECTLPDDRTFYDNPDYSDHPVVYVDWYQAKSYAEWRGASLPTEAQWEYAARGPDALQYPWGDDFDDMRLNFCDTNCENAWKHTAVDDGYGGTAPVGSYPDGQSWVGALDLGGNVWEWTSTMWMHYPYVSDDGREDQDKTDDTRVLRGGSWFFNLDLARAAVRFYYIPNALDNFTGFRLVRTH